MFYFPETTTPTVPTTQPPTTTMPPTTTSGTTSLDGSGVGGRPADGLGGSGASTTQLVSYQMPVMELLPTRNSNTFQYNLYPDDEYEMIGRWHTQAIIHLYLCQ